MVWSTVSNARKVLVPECDPSWTDEYTRACRSWFSRPDDFPCVSVKYLIAVVSRFWCTFFPEWLLSCEWRTERKTVVLLLLMVRNIPNYLVSFSPSLSVRETHLCVRFDWSFRAKTMNKRSKKNEIKCRKVDEKKRVELYFFFSVLSCFYTFFQTRIIERKNNDISMCMYVVEMSLHLW